MIKTSFSNTFPLFYIVEAAVDPDDIKTTILRENAFTTADGSVVKTVTADSTLQSFMMLNWNGRTYPAAVVMEGMDSNAKIQNDMRHKQFAGEWGHPDSKDMVRQSQILPEYTSHYIDSYRREGNLLKGHVTSAPFGRGLWMYNTLMAGRPWAFSLRAFGAVDTNNIALKPLTVITYDQVNRPSHKEAYATTNDVVGAQTYTDSFLKECSTSVLMESANIVSDITNFVLDKSDNIKIAKELFGLQESTAVFNGKNNIILEGSYLGNSIKVTVPLENYVRNIYRDILTF